MEEGKWSAILSSVELACVPSPVILLHLTERKLRVLTHRGEALGPMGSSIAWMEESTETASLLVPLLMCKSIQLCCQEAKGRKLKGCGMKGGKTAVLTRTRDGAG